MEKYLLNYHTTLGRAVGEDRGTYNSSPMKERDQLYVPLSCAALPVPGLLRIGPDRHFLDHPVGVFYLQDNVRGRYIIQVQLPAMRSCLRETESVSVPG
jgi:hypothetical protein